RDRRDSATGCAGRSHRAPSVVPLGRRPRRATACAALRWPPRGYRWGGVVSSARSWRLLVTKLTTEESRASASAASGIKRTSPPYLLEGGTDRAQRLQRRLERSDVKVQLLAEATI